ncbi:MAG: elongation factor G [Acidobacteriota bacterium]
MQVDSSDKIRNLTLAGHADTGKTTLASAALYTGGVVNRMARVEDGHTTTDFDPLEVERGHSIGLATCFVPWNDHKVNLIDTPGSGMFGVEARAGVRAGDTMVLVISAASGVEVTTERMWQYAEEIDQPVLIHINKLDRENTDFSETVAAIEDNFGITAAPLHLPIGDAQNFSGLVDLVAEKAYRFEADGDGKAEAIDIPDDLADAVEEWRTKLIEAVAETDDELMEEYFDQGTLPHDDLVKGLRQAILDRTIFPITVGSSLHGVGTSTFLDTAVELLPDPTARASFPGTDIGGEAAEIEPSADGTFAALVFKTFNDPFSGKVNIFRVVRGSADGNTAPWNARAEEAEKLGHLQVLQGKQPTAVERLVCGDIGSVAKLKHTISGDTLCAKDTPIKLGWVAIRPPAMSFAVEPKSKGDEEKISDALNRLMEEDLGLQAGRDAQTHEFLLSGSGQLHVELAVSRLKQRYKVDVILHPPKVPYRETIRRGADGHGRHKKQTGGRGQFADCRISIEPMPPGEEFEFVDEIFGGSIPQGFRPAVEKGILESAARGYLAGYPVVDFRVRLKDGQYHDVDSSEMAFKVAGSLAFKDAMASAGATLLEPVMSVEITTSEEFMGDIMGDLSQRRGKPQGMDARGDQQIIKAMVPMSEMLDYAPSLRSITQGRARFTMEFHGYEEVPKQIQQKIIADAKSDDDG